MGGGGGGCGARGWIFQPAKFAPPPYSKLGPQYSKPSYTYVFLVKGIACD